MAYISNGLSLKTDTLSGGGPREWILQNTDAVTTVRVVDYISDAQARGMEVGDLVYYTRWTTFTDQYNKAAPIVAKHIFVVMVISAAGAADLSDGTAIDVTNTD